MAKKLKGKQKVDDQPPTNITSLPPDSFNPTNVAANQPLHTVLTDERPQPPTWGTTGAGGGWGASVDNAGRGWGVSAENVGETWGMGGGNLSQQQGSDDSSLGQSEILQPPPSHTPGVLATIPEQTPPLTPYNQNRRPLSDIGENNDEYSDWDNQPDSRTTHWGENPQSHTLTATMAPSAMGSPPSQPTVSLAEAAAAAQKDLQKQGKTTTASEAARRLEESRRHSVDPQHLAAQQEASRAAHAVQHAANKKPVSSASAAAAALEGSHLRHRNIKQTDTVHSQPAPGKTSWIHPKPFMEGGRDPAHIPPDPSWIHTGGNTWSRKHLASKSVSAVNWAQPIETPWSQPHSYPPPPQGQLHRPSHKKHHSHAVYPTQHNHRPSASQHHQSWLSWGKERWIESPETESGSEDDGVNIVDSWGTYNSQHVDQGKGRDKRGRRRKDDESENRGGKGGWPQQGKAAWGEQRNEGVEHKDNDWRGGDQWGGNFGGGQDHKASVWGQEKAVWGEQRHEGGEHRDNERQGGDQWGGAFGRAQDHKASVWGQNKDPIGTEWSHDNSGPGRGHERNGSAWVEDEGKGWNNSNWNQDYNWGKDKGTGGNESGWGEQQAGDTRATGGWSQTGINDWGKKIPSTAEVVGGTRAAMSPQQISQIYNSFLNVNQTSELKGQGQQHSKTMASSKKNDQGIWEAESGWGSEADEEGGTPRRVRFSPKASELWGGSPRSVPSKTMAASQQQGVTTTLINDTSNARFVESRGAGLAFVSNALFGNTRLSKERIYWLFPQDKDHRISALLAWVQKMSFNLGTYGLMKFLEHGERGGLFVNAAFRMRQHPHEPAFDFLTFDQLQGTMDKTLQESVAFYDPARFAMAFVFLPSQSGNSVAIWRRKINVPDNARQKYRAQIETTVKSLRAPEEYIVMVDELPRKPKATNTTHKPGQLRKPAKTVNGKATSNSKQIPNAAKKPRKWWKLFLT